MQQSDDMGGRWNGGREEKKTLARAVNKIVRVQGGGTGTGVTETSPLVDEASLEKLRSQPIASDVDGLRKEIAAFKETYPVEDYDTFLSPRGPYKVPVMLNFNRTKRSTVYKALEMLAVRNEALALKLEKKRVADAVAKHASEHDLEEF
ncbi:hypothetical protein THAOC_04804, partial [Thalassiosira oceanica]